MKATIGTEPYLNKSFLTGIKLKVVFFISTSLVMLPSSTFWLVVMLLTTGVAPNIGHNKMNLNIIIIAFSIVINNYRLAEHLYKHWD